MDKVSVIFTALGIAVPFAGFGLMMATGGLIMRDGKVLNRQQTPIAYKICLTVCVVVVIGCVAGVIAALLM